MRLYTPIKQFKNVTGVKTLHTLFFYIFISELRKLELRVHPSKTQYDRNYSVVLTKLGAAHAFCIKRLNFSFR